MNLNNNYFKIIFRKYSWRIKPVSNNRSSTVILVLILRLIREGCAIITSQVEVIAINRIKVIFFFIINNILVVLFILLGDSGLSGSVRRCLSGSPISFPLATLVIDFTEQFVVAALEVLALVVRVGYVAHQLFLVVVGGEEAADPAALPTGVREEERVGVTVAVPRPLRALRVFVNTAALLCPATGVETGRLHEVIHVSVLNLPVARVGLADLEMMVQRATVILLPPPAQLRLVLNRPRFPVRSREPGLLSEGLWLRDQFRRTADHHHLGLRVKAAGLGLVVGGEVVLQYLAAPVEWNTLRQVTQSGQIGVGAIGSTALFCHRGQRHQVHRVGAGGVSDGWWRLRE